MSAVLYVNYLEVESYTLAKAYHSIPYLYSRACSFNLRTSFIDFTFRFCISFSQTLSLRLDLLCFCSNCTLALRYIAAYRFPVFQLKTFSSCVCAGLLADGTLCSDSPIDGLTALSNGTVLIFKGQNQSVCCPAVFEDTR